MDGPGGMVVGMAILFGALAACGLVAKGATALLGAEDDGPVYVAVVVLAALGLLVWAVESGWGA